MNRAPGPSDFWWKEHQQTCGGQFIKIKEPENFKAKGSKKVKSTPKNTTPANNIFTWLTKTSPSNTELKSSPNNQKSLNEFKKLGNNTNNVHGWGTGGPNAVNNSQKSNSSNITSVSKIPKFSSSGVLGGFNTGKSNLLNKFSDTDKSKIGIVFSKKAINLPIVNPVTKRSNNNNNQSSKEPQEKFVECPICGIFILNNDINKHIDVCLIEKNGETKKKEVSSQEKIDNFSLVQKRKNDAPIFSNKQLKLNTVDNSRKTNCPVCSKSFELASINEHLDKCLLETDEQANNSVTNLDDTNDKNESIISISSTSSNTSSSSLIIEDPKDSHLSSTPMKNNAIKTTPHNCLVCNAYISSGMSLIDHLEDCIGDVFNDDSLLSTDCDNEEISEISSEILIDQNDKYPCPVCVQLISKSRMNQHLDICLKST